MSAYLYLLLNEIDTNYNHDSITVALNNFWWVPILATAFYLPMVGLGYRWMKPRRPYNLRGPLFVWNMALAIFSIITVIILGLPLIESLMNKGFLYSVCYTNAYSVPLEALTCFLFLVSKYFELFDTFFVVARKSPLYFLHWYHHASVVILTHQALAVSSPLAHLLCVMNAVVHSIMYSYFLIKSTGIFVPKMVAKGITTIQLLQFIIGLLAIFTVMLESCPIDRLHLALTTFTYSTYFILFVNFFYQRYVKPGQKKKE